MRSERMASAFEDERTYVDGQLIVAEGDEGHEMFIIREGEVVVSRRVAGADVVFDTLGRGQMFGEMSLLESLPRDADARARGPVRLVALGPGTLLVWLRRDPSFAIELLRVLSRRVRALNAKLADALEEPAAPLRPEG